MAQRSKDPRDEKRSEVRWAIFIGAAIVAVLVGLAYVLCALLAR